jgi:GTP-binding protein EngB required for normal cell division
MTERLLVGVMGRSNAGKSETWTELFGAEVKTSAYGNERELC